MNMNRSQPCENLNSSTPLVPLSPFRVRSYPAMPVPLNPGERSHDEYDGDADIRAVGIGTLGCRMVQLLARNLPGVTCHEIAPTNEQGASDDIAMLLSSIRTSHLVFILTGFDNENSDSVAQAVGRASCGAGVLTLVVTPRTGYIVPQCEGEQGKWYDAMFSVSDESLPEQQEAVVLSTDTLIGYSMRHMVAVLTNLIVHRRGICIDFADITAIMKDGSTGRMGVGIASGDSRGATAAERAMERLEAQGIRMSETTGVLASVHGSGSISMDDFDAASKVIHEHVSPDANVVVGVISDENLGGFVKVTLLSAH